MSEWCSSIAGPACFLAPKQLGAHRPEHLVHVVSIPVGRSRHPRRHVAGRRVRIARRSRSSFLSILPRMFRPEPDCAKFLVPLRSGPGRRCSASETTLLCLAPRRRESSPAGASGAVYSSFRVCALGLSEAGRTREGSVRGWEGPRCVSTRYAEADDTAARAV